MKENLKKIGMLLLTVITIISLCMNGVSADSISNKLTIKSTSVSGSNTPVKFPVTFHVKKTTGGKYVYCTYYAKKTPSSGITYTKGSLITDNGMNYILKEAYNNVNGNNSFFIYQTALWIYMIDKGKMPQPYATLTKFKNTVNNSSSANAKKIKTLVANAKKAGKNDTSDATISFGTTSFNFTLSSDKKNYVSNKIKVNSSTSSYKVTFTNAPKNTTYKVSGGYLYIYVPASSVSKLNTTFKVTISNSKTIYKSYTYKPSSSVYQTMAATYKTTSTASKTVSMTLSRTTSITVNKIDSTTNKAVSGAKLQVKNSKGTVIGSWTSDGKTHTVNGLIEGTYTLSEISAPSGYNLNTSIIKFTVDANGVIKDAAGKTIASLTIKNTPALKVEKVDSTTNKAVSGAKLQVKDSKGTVIDSWTTDGKAHTVKTLSKGTYTLSEISAPSGYNLNTSTIKFTVDDNGNMKDSTGKAIVTLTMKNTQTSVNISKQDITTSKELPGATLLIKDSKGNVKYTWVSTNEVHKITGIPSGTYTLTETIAPEGYKLSEETIKFTIDKYGKLTNESGDSISKVVMYNSPKDDTYTAISKQDITTNKELPGATLVVKDSKGNTIDTWVSTDESHIIKNLKAGTYTLTETIAPEGYELSTETIKFTIDKDGNTIDETGKTISKIVMYNKKIVELDVKISKQDITTSKELPGATLVAKDSKGNTIDTWISTNEVHYIKALKPDTYTLTETIAPEGYKLSTETIKFTIDENGSLLNAKGEKISKVIMYNEPNDDIYTSISKQDITTSKELPGATLVVKDVNGNVIDTWVSTNEVHKIKNLRAGTYNLIETIAPEGYKLSTETITFSVDKEGKLTNEKGQEIAKVIMYNKPIPKTDVNISKQDITTSKELPGATLVVKDANGNVIDTWVSTNEVHKIKDLTEGTYTLTETIAPDGYELSTETIKFTIDSNGNLNNADGNSVSKIVMYNSPIPKTGTAIISKQDASTHETISGATLVIKNSNGEIVDEWISTEESHKVENLEIGTYTLTETIAPKGYILSNKTITFIVNEEGKITDTNGKELSSIIIYNEKEEIPTQVKISKQDITNGKEVAGAHLVIKDESGNIVAEWVSGTTPHYIDTLKPGVYTLTETIAPDGYILSNETITFTVNDDGSVTTVIMYNQPKDTPIHDTPKGEVIEVENTASKRDIKTSLMGLITFVIGFRVIVNSIVRKKEEI